MSINTGEEGYQQGNGSQHLWWHQSKIYSEETAGIVAGNQGLSFFMFCS